MVNAGEVKYAHDFRHIVCKGVSTRINITDKIFVQWPS